MMFVPRFRTFTVQCKVSVWPVSAPLERFENIAFVSYLTYF